MASWSEAPNSQVKMDPNTVHLASVGSELIFRVRERVSSPVHNVYRAVQFLKNERV
jgi:hypothetical protein